MCKNKNKGNEKKQCSCVIEKRKKKKKEPIDKIFFRPESHLTNYSKSFGNVLEQGKIRKY